MRPGLGCGIALFVPGILLAVAAMGTSATDRHGGGYLALGAMVALSIAVMLAFVLVIFHLTMEERDARKRARQDAADSRVPEA